MGNQGKIAKKQSDKVYVFLRVSVLSFIFEKRLDVFIFSKMFTSEVASCISCFSRKLSNN